MTKVEPPMGKCADCGCYTMGNICGPCAAALAASPPKGESEYTEAPDSYELISDLNEIRSRLGRHDGSHPDCASCRVYNHTNAAFGEAIGEPIDTPAPVESERCSCLASSETYPDPLCPVCDGSGTPAPVESDHSGIVQVNEQDFTVESGVVEAFETVGDMRQAAFRLCDLVRGTEYHAGASLFHDRLMRSFPGHPDTPIAALASSKEVTEAIDQGRALGEAASTIRYALHAIETEKSEPLFVARDALRNWLDDYASGGRPMCAAQVGG
jgi:hypothetical protein